MKSLTYSFWLLYFIVLKSVFLNVTFCFHNLSGWSKLATRNFRKGWFHESYWPLASFKCMVLCRTWALLVVTLRFIIVILVAISEWSDAKFEYKVNVDCSVWEFSWIRMKLQNIWFWNFQDSFGDDKTKQQWSCRNLYYYYYYLK